jgi:hypothetical protein
MNYDYIGATGENNIKDYIDITSNILNINSSNLILNSSNYTSNASNILQNNLNTVNNKLIVIDNSISSINSSITTLQNEVIAVQGETTANTAAIADISPIVAADTITLAGLVPVVGGHTLAIISLDGSIANCLKKENIDSGNIGLYQSLGGAFLNIVYNLNHFKDVPVIGTNREFNLNDTYANLPTTKNNKITWTSPLNYNTSTDTATIDLSNYYNKSEIVNISNNNNLNNSNYAANISNIIIRNSSNYASNISNVIIINSSNYASNISNVIIRNSSNYASNISNVIIINNSNYASNISNIIIRNSSNYASNISNVLLTNISLNNSNYVSNISNVIITNVNNNYLKLSGGTLTGTLNGTVINATSTTTASDFKGIYIMHATRQSHLPYLPNSQFYFRAPVNIDNDADYLSFGSRTGNFIIKLFGEDYGFGINSFTLRYNAGLTASHKFYTGSTNTFTIHGDGNISTLGTITEAGTLLTNKYLQLAGGNMTANANITLSGTGTFTGKHSGDGSLLTNLPLSSYSTSGNDANYVLKSGSTMTGALTVPNITLGSGGKINSADDYHYIQISQPTDTLTIQEYGTISFNIGETKTQKAYINSTGLTVSGTCSATTFSGNGANINNLTYNNITGSPWINSGTNKMYNKDLSSGFVGIGVSDPLGTLEIRGYNSIFQGSIEDNKIKFGHSNLWSTNQLFCNRQFRFLTSETATSNIAFFGYIDSYDNPVNRTMILAITRTSCDMTGNITATKVINAPIINASSNFNINSVNINNWLFNSTGTNHEATPDFNNINKFGYTFINGGTNGPTGTGDTQFYSWFIGLGANYPAMYGTIGSYGMQFAIGRTADNPILSIRRNQNNSWTAWQGITAASLTAGDKTIVGNLSLGAGTTNSYQLLINRPTPTAAASIQTIQQGIGYNQKLTLQAISGTVGIGTTDPETKLDVNGSILLRTAAATSGGTGGIFFRNGYTSVSPYNCSIMTYDHNADTFCDGISINGYDGVSICTGLNERQERMRVNVNGNVGIGTTNPQTKLDIFDATNPKIFLNQNGTTRCFISGTSSGLDLGNDVGTSKIIRFMPDNVERMRINSSGNAGLGITNPNCRLYISTNAGNNVNSFAIRVSSGGGTDGSGFATLIGLGAESGGWSKCAIGHTRTNGYDVGDIVFLNRGTIDNADCTMSDVKMRINSAGNISMNGYLLIGSGNFTHPLVVNATTNSTFSYVYVRVGFQGGADFNSTSYNANVSAVFAGSIYITTNIINSSDIRIKKEINDINDDGALQQILAIEPKTYKYIDFLSKGSSVVYGFIAQQVKEVIPHAVETVKDTIPNIYKPAFCSSNIITLDNDVSQDLNIGDNIKIYDELGKDDIYNITEINSNIIKIDKDINSSNVFVYGKEIEDFHTLKKDYIFSLNVCATQELYKLIQNQNIIIEELKNRISILEQK